MKYILRIAFIGMILCCGSSMLQAQRKAVKAIHKNFDSYKEAILENRGEVATNCVDSRTIAYYDQLIHWVRTADSISVEQLPIIDKMMVLSIRHRTPKDQIMQFDGRALLVYAVESGMVGKSSVINNTLGDITVTGTSAKAQLLVNGETTPLHFQFYLEDKKWKLDLTSVLDQTAAALEQMLATKGMSSTEFVLTMCKMTNGITPLPSIWTPVESL